MNSSSSHSMTKISLVDKTGLNKMLKTIVRRKLQPTIRINKQRLVLQPHFFINPALWFFETHFQKASYSPSPSHRLTMMTFPPNLHTSSQTLLTHTNWQHPIMTTPNFFLTSVFIYHMIKYCFLIGWMPHPPQKSVDTVTLLLLVCRNGTSKIVCLA